MAGHAGVRLGSFRLSSRQLFNECLMLCRIDALLQAFHDTAHVAFQKRLTLQPQTRKNE
jgi:hypothetical protein